MRVELPGGGACEVPIRESKIADVLRELRINPLDVIVVKNGRIVPEDDDVRDGDCIRLIDVKSGG
ncbi:MAG: MoaD/ThiS family protein [Methanomicrobiales archaeon]|nr:MoaD/ThiS family protein [Methanomicrobiales archaeon]MDI6877316.1 MoaD/ThiS family protein [Methanomicrobiales archaeon]